MAHRSTVGMLREHFLESRKERTDANVSYKGPGRVLFKQRRKLPYDFSKATNAGRESTGVHKGGQRAK